jgi:hypothetical protein
MQCSASTVVAYTIPVHVPAHPSIRLSAHVQSSLNIPLHKKISLLRTCLSGGTRGSLIESAAQDPSFIMSYLLVTYPDIEVQLCSTDTGSTLVNECDVICSKQM